jgi:protein-S-isoprenylcysteine O-methyltransferase Ste14
MAILRVLVFPSLVVAVTLTWLWLDRLLDVRGISAPRAGMTLVAIGGLLAGWCALLFARIGRGSPNPFVAKTQRMVTSGPYAVIRNPMMYGVGLVLIGLALWVGSLMLWVGFVFFVVFVSRFVPGYEEPDMKRRFGEEYREYCRRVPRWFPRVFTSGNQ